MQDNAERVAPLNPLLTGHESLVPLELNERQVRYLLSLLDPIVGALDASEHEDSLAWQIERVLDSELLHLIDGSVE